MREFFKKTATDRRSWVAGALLLASGVAYAFPWDIDMVDAVYLRAYEWKMLPNPEGTVSRDNYVANHDRNSPEGMALTNPYTVDDALVAQGEQMFGVYCQTCHGKQGRGGAEVMKNDPTVGMYRFPVAAPMLSGEGNVSVAYPDGKIYLTIRNGAAIMPGYGQAMNDQEMWAIVSYIRSLPNAQYAAPAPPAEEGI